MAKIEKITPHLWFESQAEEAAKYYVGIFKDSSIEKTSHYTKAGQEIHKQPPGKVMTVEFNLGGQKFLALNGGPIFKFNEAVSFVITCDTQEEIDYYWNHLTAGGDPKSQQCGWLKDKFGLSWQVVPANLSKLMTDVDKEKSGRVMNALLKMKKLNIKELDDAGKD